MKSRLDLSRSKYTPYTYSANSPHLTTSRPRDDFEHLSVVVPRKPSCAEELTDILSEKPGPWRNCSRRSFTLSCLVRKYHSSSFILLSLLIWRLPPLARPLSRERAHTSTAAFTAGSQPTQNPLTGGRSAPDPHRRSTIYLYMTA